MYSFIFLYYILKWSNHTHEPQIPSGRKTPSDWDWTPLSVIIWTRAWYQICFPVYEWRISPWLWCESLFKNVPGKVFLQLSLSRLVFQILWNVLQDVLHDYKHVILMILYNLIHFDNDLKSFSLFLHDLKNILKLFGTWKHRLCVWLSHRHFSFNVI